MEAAEQPRALPALPLQPRPGDAHNAMETAVSQHLLSLTDDQLAIVDRALTDLETQLSPPASLDGDQRQQPMPPSLKQDDTRTSLAALNPLRMRLQRLQRLVQYARDAEIILFNDALNHTLKGHALFSGSGRHLDRQALLDEPLIEPA